MNIRGTFDHGVTQLATAESQSFKLSLINEPQQVLNGQKIGTVTVHISKTEFDDFVTVSNEQELLNALTDGGSIKFINNIKLSEAVDIRSNVAIDLNGFTFDGNALFIEENVEMSISGGTIEAYPRNRGGNLIISDCTINGSTYAIDNVTGTVRLDNTTVYAQLYITGGTVELGADVTLIDTNALCTRGDGSIICHFDPSGHLEKYSKATNNGDGTWTVRYSK